MNEEQLFEQCLKKWGNKSQLLMLAEECSELTKAILKLNRNYYSPKNFENYVEELADVNLMLTQMIYFLSPRDLKRYFEFRKLKVRRVKKLLRDIN